eukprot:11937662-Heterocapsa_arctica.AAC.1
MGQFSSLRSQSEIRTIGRIIEKMLSDVTPDISVKAGGPIFDKMFNQLHWFIKFEQEGDEEIIT